MSDRTFWIVLLMVVLLGFGVRSLRLIDRPFTSDEFYELRHLSTSLFEIGLDPDGFPPLFRWILSLWIAPLGTDFCRMVPAAFGIATIVVIALLVRDLAGVEAALGAAAFAAFSAHQVEFSQQCRAYSLYILMASVVMWTANTLRSKDSIGAWVAFLISSMVLFWTHYFAITLVGLVWSLLLVERCRSELGIGRVIFASLVFAIMSLPWFFWLKIDTSNPVPPEIVNDFDLTSFLYFHLTLIEGWSIGLSAVELSILDKRIAILQIAPWAIVSAGCCTLLAWNSLKSFGWRTMSWSVVFLSVVPLTTFGMAWLLNIYCGHRYLAWLSVPLAFLVGAGTEWNRRSIYTVATYVLIGINLLSTFNRLYVDRFEQEDYRAVADFLKSVPGKKAVVAVQHYQGFALLAELGDDILFQSISEGTLEPLDWNLTLPKLVSKLEVESRVFLVVERLRKSDIRLNERQKLLDRLGVKLLPQVSNTLEIYEVDTSELIREFPAINVSN